MSENPSGAATAGRRLLDPSELGTKVYWEAVYDRELHNHEEDQEDEGTVWFSESNAEQAVSKQLNQIEEKRLLYRACSSPSELAQCNGDREEVLPAQPSRFLDLGTGNGHMLFELSEGDEDGNAWLGEMVGVDYSATSTALAKRIAAQRFADDPVAFQRFRFECWDLLSDKPGDWLKDGFDVVLDKGTFDAISLMPSEEGSQHPCETYRSVVASLVKPGLFLFVTSCNWTRDELIGWLAPDGSDLAFYDEAKYRTFTFGGQTGQSIVTIVFRRKAG